MKLRLRTRITVVFVLIVVLVTTAASVFGVVEGRREIERSVAENQELAGENAAAGLDELFASSERLLSATAGQLQRDDLVPDVDEAAVGRVLDPVLAYAGMFEALAIVDADGAVRTARPLGSQPAGFDDDPALTESVTTGNASLALGPADGGVHWVVPVPATEDSPRPSYLIGVLRPDRIEGVLFTNLPPQTDAVFVSASGAVVAATEPELDMDAATDTGSPVDGVRVQAATGEEGTTLSDYILTRRSLDLHPGDIMLFGSVAQVEALGAQLVRNAVYTGVILSAAGVLVAVYFAGLVSRPLARMERATHAMADGVLSARVQPTGAKEFVGLAESFNRMADNLQKDREALLALQGRLEDRVTQRTKELERRQQDMELFFYAVTHDLKNPAIAVAGFVDIMNEELEEEGEIPIEDLRHYLSRIDASAINMERLIRQILQFAKVERDEPAHERFELATLVDRVVDGIRGQADQKDVHITQVGPVCPMVSDPDRLDHVVTNLVENAVKYMGDGHRKRVDIRWTADRDTVRLEVQDNGTGIDADQLASLFEPFQRGRRTRATTTGSGLGLHIVHRMVESLGGTTAVDSTPGRGTRFTVTVPRSPRQAQQPS